MKSCIFISILSLSLGSVMIANDIKNWNWHYTDCNFKNEIDPSKTDTENCGMPTMIVIKAKDIQQAYNLLLLHEKYDKELLPNNLPTTNYTYTYIEYVLDGVEFKNVATFLWHDKHKLQIKIGFADGCTNQYFTFFDLGNNQIKIVEQNDSC
ncbi:hypothetical protein [Helicobacter trogontum]|uniref:Uncharacterized protein n=1 Tax=Helicobacter trogontum TaxID=50960 RepID=A0A4U8T433_9HELI|nr:hypothetical protein [Helicobacter trogontum]MCI5787339.1 hypothetical protein [Helicobacter trogontum]MDY5184332.1 hypothetical protein [Helicobacter trogontum]TLD94255.1 hypothetical protein LS80_010325 [Helicobacter trogontum]